VRQYGISRFHLADTATNASPKNLGRLCDLLIDAKLGVSIRTSVLVSRQMTQELYSKMYRAGFDELHFGIESGSTTTLNVMGKRGGAEWAARNLAMAGKVGFHNRLFFIVGHPAEGEKEFQETLDFLGQNKKYIHEIAMVNPCHVFQDTRLHIGLHEKGVVMPEGWTSFASWAYGENTIVERLRRKTSLLERARDLGIPIAAQTQFYEQTATHPPLRAALGRAWRSLKRYATNGRR
jgi:radical SAM superfamily enzyme YgiQ (UPF0313 family)